VEKRTVGGSAGKEKAIGCKRIKNLNRITEGEKKANSTKEEESKGK